MKIRTAAFAMEATNEFQRMMPLCLRGWRRCLERWIFHIAWSNQVQNLQIAASKTLGRLPISGDKGAQADNMGRMSWGCS